MVLIRKLSEIALEEIAKDSRLDTQSDMFVTLSHHIASDFDDLEYNLDEEFVSKEDYLILIDFTIKKLENRKKDKGLPSFFVNYIDSIIYYLTQKISYIDSMNTEQIVAVQKFEELIKELKKILSTI